MRAQDRTVAFDGRVPYPDFVSIETTMKCNLRCPMCLPFLEGTTVAGRHMDWDDFESIAKALFPYVDRFQLTVSGEPLMSRGLPRMLELAAEYGVRTESYTNGTLLNDRMIALVLPTLGEMCISFDGATKETFEALRAGATFEHVVRNVEKLAAAVRALPDAARPTLGFAVTIMERNVRELPAIVELAHRIGLDFVTAAHVFPVIAQMQRQSLAHHVALGAEWIGKAAARAEELGMPFHVQPLDQVIVAMAMTDSPSGMTDRAIAGADGILDALSGRVVHASRRRPPPPPPLLTDSARRHVAERAARRRRAADIPAPPSAPLPEAVWHCDFLWNRIYVNTEGTVRPCCVPGVPEIGSFRDEGVAVWDNDVYRAMRIGLVRREPAPVCRGCQHIVETRDPKAIAALLQGRALPEPAPLPPILRPVVEAPDVLVCGTPDAPRTYAAAPTFTWPQGGATEGYEFEAVATQDGKVLRFDTVSRRIPVPEPRIAIPAWVWEAAPKFAAIRWQALARLPTTRVVVARGCCVRVGPVDPPAASDAAPA